MIRYCYGSLVVVFLLFPMLIFAQESQTEKEVEIKLTDDKSYLHVIHEGQSVKVQRVQDPDYVLKGYYAKTARKCPPFCLQPMHVAPGVVTIGEVGTISRKLEEIGIINNEGKTEKWDFTHAKELVLWCNGPECGQSPRAIKGLLNVGYPANKIIYYRGGMQMWQLWGLTTVVPGE